jgi:hypothetical protein
MDGIFNIIVSLIAGAGGGNASAAALKNLSLGPVGNSVAGAIGGLGGSQLISILMPALVAGTAGGGFDVGALLTNVIGSGVGGAALQLIAGFIKNAMAK